MIKKFCKDSLNLKFAEFLSSIGLHYYSNLIWNDIKRNKYMYHNDLLASDYGLDRSFSYFILVASLGDKWKILSYLPALLKLQSSVKILASEDDANLIRIFLGIERMSRSVVFMDQNKLISLSSKITPISIYSTGVIVDPGRLIQGKLIQQFGFPLNSIRHLHVVKYSYFAELFHVYGVSYGTLLKMIMYLPSSARPCNAEFYSEEDIEVVNKIIDNSFNHQSSGFVLFNIVNFSHEPLSLHQIKIVVHAFESCNFQVLINATDYPDMEALEDLLPGFSYSKIIFVPKHLLSLLSERAAGVFGVIGGAMNVAVQFTKTHCLSLGTAGLGFKLSWKEAHGGRYPDNVWSLYNEDWPCLVAGRVVENIDCEDIKNVKDEQLENIVMNFSVRIKESMAQK